MRRTALERRRRPSRAARVAAIEDLPRRLFREAARDQRTYRLPSCRQHRAPHAHHVVYEQHARREGANPHDGRNALRICSHCHRVHHDRIERIPTSALPDAAIAYARDTFGPAAIDYFRRYYRGADEDPRLVARAASDDDGGRSA